MRTKVRKNLQNIIFPKDTLLVGVSGGADSVCLLMVLYALSGEMDFSIEAVHVEHGIRGQESLEDAAFVQELCKQMQVPLTQISVDVPTYSKAQGIGTEEAARLLRYSAFEKLAKEKQAKVALAHHMEDNAETVLFQLLRGSSLSGLCGMKPLRVDEHGVTYIRPLLSIHRKEIENYLRQQGQSYRTDSTNASLDYHRNYIRKVILPELTNINEQAVAHIHTAASQLMEIRDFLQAETDKAWDQCVHIIDKDNTQEIAADIICGKNNERKQQILQIDIEQLAEYHIAVQKEVVYTAIAHMLGLKKDISNSHVQDVLELCRKQSGKEVYLPKGLIAKREYSMIKFFYLSENINLNTIMYHENKDNFTKQGEDNHVCISAQQMQQWARSKEPIVVPFGEKGEYLQVRVLPYYGKSAEIPQKTYTKWLDYDKIKTGFCIRTSQSGDAFISDVFGHRKKLKRYFIDEKIPASQRECMWLLAQEQTVLWLIGGRISEHVKVTDDTKNILEITIHTSAN